MAHEACDDEDQSKVVSAQGESVSPQSQPGSNVTIKFFQYQPGRIQVKAGTTVTWMNEDGSVYGPDAEKAFLPLWREHIGFFVDYTTGGATKDKAKQDKAIADLVSYSEDFAAFLSSANPNLPKTAVTELVKKSIERFANAEAWILETDAEWIFSFVNCCEVLGIAPDYLRQGLLRWKHGKRARLASIPATPRTNFSKRHLRHAA
jgi:plastocyanin